MSSPEHDKNLWQRIVDQLRREWEELPTDERAWISGQVEKLGALQGRLHQFFLDVDGASACRDCVGDCCGHGRFHPTLANLLACLVNRDFPDPDFGQDCPYMGHAGCQFPPEFRPYNCITFICDRIEDKLPVADRGEFYRLDKEIREVYALFAGRYAGGSLRGILIRDTLLPRYLARR